MILRKVTLPVVMIIAVIFVAFAPSSAAASTPTYQLIVDTDAGVDDAAALAWLLDQHRYDFELDGIVTVAGNTTAANSANNVLYLLGIAGVETEVVIGAAAPLLQVPSTTGQFVHGPDGLWFDGISNPQDISGLSTDPVAFYCDTVTSETMILALGPLTNLALAAEACPETMAAAKEIVVLGGADDGGNATPNAEFNIWFDPEAADIVFDAGLPITLVPLDTFNEFQIDQDDLDRLAEDGSALAQAIVGPLTLYAQAGAGLGEFESTSVPDVVAVMYALESRFGKEESALVKVVPGFDDSTEARLLRGITTIGIGIEDKIPMIATDEQLSDIANQAFTNPDFNFEAELGAILASEPDNADVVVDIRQRLMVWVFIRDLTR